MSFLARSRSSPAFFATCITTCSSICPLAAIMAAWKASYLPCFWAARATRVAVDRILAEDRKLLVDDADLAVLAQQRLERRLDLLAIGAAVVEELDDRDVAVGIAGDRRGRVGDEALVLLGESRRGAGLGVRIHLVLRPIGAPRRSPPDAAADSRGRSSRTPPSARASRNRRPAPGTTRGRPARRCSREEERANGRS